VPVQRGDLYDTRFDPVEGSEQAGTRPAVVVSRDSLHTALSTVTMVPCTTYRPPKHIYPTHTLIQAPEGGLTVDSIVIGEQVRTVSQARLLRYRGTLSAQAMAAVDRALRIALDL
jgi:mRNA interferase MazF